MTEVAVVEEAAAAVVVESVVGVAAVPCFARFAALWAKMVAKPSSGSVIRLSSAVHSCCSMLFQDPRRFELARG